MKNILYKLIFPEVCKLYLGKTTVKTRYGQNKPNERFIGPHHNVEVQNLLDNGEFCYFHVVKVFKTSEELSIAEETYLKKVWSSDDWKKRPRWLTNRSRTSTGFPIGDLHHNKTEENRLRIGAQSKKLHIEGKIPTDNFFGKPWKPNHPQRHWDPEEVFQKVEKILLEKNFPNKWGRKNLALELNISEPTLQRIASKVREKWKHLLES